MSDQVIFADGVAKIRLPSDQIFQAEMEHYVRVRNATGQPIPGGTPVVLTERKGDLFLVVPANDGQKADGEIVEPMPIETQAYLKVSDTVLDSIVQRL